MQTDCSWTFRCSLLYCVSFALIGLLINALGPFIPFLAQKAMRAEGDYGIIFLTRGGGYLFGNLMWGQLDRNYDSHHLMVVCCSILSLTLFLIPRTQSIALLSFLFTAGAVGCSGLQLLGQSLLIRMHQRSVDTWMQVLHFSFGLGSLISPFLVGLLGHQSFTLYALAALVLVFCYLKQRSPEHSVEQSGKGENMKKEVLVVCACWFMVYVGIQVAYAGWVPTFAISQGDFKKENAAFCSGIYWLFLTLGRFIAVLLSNVYSSAFQLQTLTSFCACICMANVVLVLCGYISTAAIFGSMAVGLGLSAMYPLTVSSLAQKGYLLSTVQLSIFVTTSSVGEGLIPAFVGFLITGREDLLYTMMLVGTLILIYLSHLFLRQYPPPKAYQQQLLNNEQISFT